MKKLLFFVALAFCFLPAPASAKSWEVASWDADICVNPDSSILVREAVAYDFLGDFTWVTRNLPDAKGIVYSDVRVFDERGTELGNGDVDIDNKQRSVDITVHFTARDEQKQWVFEYLAWNALGYFDEYDELYWNAVMIERDVPIDTATATVRLPEAVAPGDIRQRLFVGPVGSTSESPDISVSPENGTLRYEATNVGPYESMTIVAGWPKGIVTPTVREIERPVWWPLWFYGRWVYFASPLLLLLFLFRRWHRSGRDPEGRKTIVPQYEPPDKIRPAVLGVLIDEKADLKDLTATIVDLAVRGYLRIRETEEPGIFKNKKSYALEKRTAAKSGDTLSSFSSFEQQLLDDLFESGGTVQLNDLKNKFYKKIKPLNEMLYEEATSFGYFEKNPEKVRQKYLIIGILLLVGGAWALFVPIAWGVMLIAFSFAMPKRTAKGVAAYEWAKGFKMYLHTAERFRLQDQKPEFFERFLPYAMVFGVEKDWAGRFVDIYKQPPDWYAGSMAHGFLVTSFASDLQSSFAHSLSQTLASSPSSSSGFGGGGFSGGGGGGGGGGAG